MGSIYDLISDENPIFRAYAFWSAVLVVKIFAMAILTSMQRVRTKAFANPEDCMGKLKPTFNVEDVERVRRAHRNDLENILPFFVVGFLYVLTDPSTFLAVNLFRAVGISRIIHSIVYAVIPLPQPARGLAFGGALFPTVYMSIQVMLYFL